MFRQAICLLLLALSSGAAAVPLEAMRAAYLFNFAQFVTWPDEGATPLNLCIPAPEKSAKELDVLNGRKVRQMTLKVIYGVGNGDLARCKIVYLPGGAGHTLDRIRGTLRNLPVLIVGDGAAAAELGAGIGIYLGDNGNLAFDLNLEAMSASGLNISSRVLPLARKVYR